MTQRQKEQIQPQINTDCRRYGRFARALKNSQLSSGESHVIFGTGHTKRWERLTGLALEDKFINVTLKKTVDWVELKLSQSQISNPPTGAEPVSKK